MKKAILILVGIAVLLMTVGCSSGTDPMPNVKAEDPRLPKGGAQKAQPMTPD